MDRNSIKKYLVYILFAVLFLIRLININNPPLDYSSWRQVDTDSIARNFVEYKFNIFYPSLNYDGPMPNYAQLELQVTTFIIALLYKKFGFIPALGRIVPIAFFMGSCYYLYCLVKKKSGVEVALLAVAFYGILPLNVVYSRNIMPESALMFFAVGGLYYFDLWIEKEKTECYLAAIAYTALTGLTKVPGLLIGIPMIGQCIVKWGPMRAVKNIKLYIFAVLSLAIPWLYFYWLGTIAEQNFVEGIGRNLILPNFFRAVFQGENLSYLIEQLTTKVFTIPGIILFFIGLLSGAQRENTFYWAWLMGAFIHVMLICAVIHLDYYLMFITPVISIFMGMGGTELARAPKFKILLAAGIAMMIINTACFMNLAYKVNDRYISIGNHVSSCTENEDLIIIDRESPELFYTCHRKGWRLYGNLLSEENINRLVEEGADYFVPYLTGAEGDFMEYLNRNYEKITFSDGYYIYKLK